MSWKFPYLTTTSTTSKALATGAVVGVAVATVVCLAAALSPLAAADRPALGLLGLLIALPLGALCARRADSMAQFRRSALAAVAAAVTGASVLTVAEPSLWIRALAWFLPAAILGAAATGARQGAGIAAVVAWLALCGLPFYYDALPAINALELWAVGGSPWLGFSSDALGGDPLRREVIYLGQWSDLTDQPAAGFLTAGALWIAAVLATAVTAMLQTPSLARSDRPATTISNS